MVECQSIEQVREQIDALDRRIVQLLAERSGYVRQAARFKTDADAVRAPQRVEQVIAKVRALAAENGAPVEVIEQVYRAMINAFIDAELAEHAALNPSA
ncbi:chorismate mutase [Metapseudomonas otitidis]|uniref:chorismate mutase n=1 Tax=Metapseudomonas otitidis TaxID=319939 RepID=UPI001AAF8B71|nr:chorismate mutase [Pseudomonas otitidis]MBO2928017.1 chorismate mutase [Pseudomonas otitidis]QZX82835.1 chorismate mutase [Pseudomonas otitidis]